MEHNCYKRQMSYGCPKSETCIPKRSKGTTMLGGRIPSSISCYNDDHKMKMVCTDCYTKIKEQVTRNNNVMIMGNHYYEEYEKNKWRPRSKCVNDPCPTCS